MQKQPLLRRPNIQFAVRALRLAIVLGAAVLLPAGLRAQTRLGLHVTQEELDIWRQRANGTDVTNYKSAGDVSAYSPGDWDRIASNTTSFYNNPSQERYLGPTQKCTTTNGVTTCTTLPFNQAVPRDAGPNPTDKGVKTLSAAFYYLVKKNSPTGLTPTPVQIAQKVRAELLAQAAEPGMDMSNTTRWATDLIRDGAPAMFIAAWFTRLYFAYDYIDDGTILSAADKQVLDKWFFDAATYFQARNIDVDLNKPYVNRNAGDYNYSGYAIASGVGNISDYTHKNADGTPGNGIPNLAKWYNNRRGTMVEFYNLVGVKTNNATFTGSAKLFVKEMLMFSTFPDGSVGEFERTEANATEQGWQYAMILVNNLLSIADHQARKGDFELYDYTTSQGKGPTVGGSKNLKLISELMVKLIDNTSLEWYHQNETNLGNANYRINGVDAINNRHYVHEIWISLSNTYWKSNFIKRRYTRTEPGTVPYPNDNPSATPYQDLHGAGSMAPWHGGFGSYPGVLFMFGQMDGRVYPYLNTAPTANAGTDKTIALPTNSVTLTGSGSDADGSIATYAWTKQSGPAATLGATNAATLSVSNLTAGTYAFRLTVTDNHNRSASDEVTVTVNEGPLCPVSSGTILREVWTGLDGSDLVSSVPFGTPPVADSTRLLTSFEGPVNVSSYYGSRISGYVQAPVTGNYVFYIAGDNNCELWLSTSDAPAGKVKIAEIAGVNAYSSYRQWNKYPMQQSAPVALVAGQRYYVEALHKETAGGDHLSVGWQLPDGTLERPIPGNRLSPAGGSTGQITREKWDNIGGTEISTIPLNTTPSSTTSLNILEGPSNVGDSYGTRIRGYIYPPASGSYTFWVAGDDKCELWLSTGDNPANKVKIAYTDLWTYSREYNKYPSQQSSPVSLTGGRKYYIEVLQKEHGGGDAVSVGWQLPGGTLERPVPGCRLSPFAGSGARTAFGDNPASATAVRVYPNPFSNRITIDAGREAHGPVAVTVTDALGKNHYRGRHTLGAGQPVLTIRLEGRTKPGVYFLRLDHGNGKVTTTKVLKQ